MGKRFFYKIEDGGAQLSSQLAFVEAFHLFEIEPPEKFPVKLFLQIFPSLAKRGRNRTFTGPPHLDGRGL